MFYWAGDLSLREYGFSCSLYNELYYVYTTPDQYTFHSPSLCTVTGVNTRATKISRESPCIVSVHRPILGLCSHARKPKCPPHRIAVVVSRAAFSSGRRRARGGHAKPRRHTHTQAGGRAAGSVPQKPSTTFTSTSTPSASGIPVADILPAGVFVFVFGREDLRRICAAPAACSSRHGSSCAAGRVDGC